MESRREKAYNFSYCLFAYIYKDIHEKTNLPVTVDYTVPNTVLFKGEIGDCVLNVCRIHEAFLNPIFSKVFPSMCTSEVYFFEYVKWYYEKVACAFNEKYHNIYIKYYTENVAGPFFIKFLTTCSFIAELVRFCFRKQCYSFTSSAPTSLAEIILKIPEIGDFFSSITNTFIVFNQFCLTVMNDVAIDANSLCDLFKQQSDILQDNCCLSLLMNYQPQAMLTLADSSREKMSDESELIIPHREHSKRKFEALNGSGLPTNTMCDTERCSKFSNADYIPEYRLNDLVRSDLPEQKRCPHCGETCLAYLVDFVDDFKITNFEDND